jgi:hypothetical protein
MEEWVYGSTYSWCRHLLEVSGQLHAPTALPPGKEPSIFIRQEAACAPDPVWATWRGQNSLGRPARRQSLCLLHYSGPIERSELTAVKRSHAFGRFAPGISLWADLRARAWNMYKRPNIDFSHCWANGSYIRSSQKSFFIFNMFHPSITPAF